MDVTASDMSVSGLYNSVLYMIVIDRQTLSHRILQRILRT